MKDFLQAGAYKNWEVFFFVIISSVTMAILFLYQVESVQKDEYTTMQQCEVKISGTTSPWNLPEGTVLSCEDAKVFIQQKIGEYVNVLMRVLCAKRGGTLVETIDGEEIDLWPTCRTADGDYQWSSNGLFFYKTDYLR